MRYLTSSLTSKRYLGEYTPISFSLASIRRTNLNVLIKVQILLRKAWRTTEGIATVKEIAASLGIKPTTSGAASVSAEIESEAFEALFGERAQEVAPRPPNDSDFGSPGGAISGVLSIPEPLQRYVESISVAPPHIRMDGPGKAPAA
jgi:hypothetical protein